MVGRQTFYQLSQPRQSVEEEGLQLEGGFNTEIAVFNKLTLKRYVTKLKSVKPSGDDCSTAVNLKSDTGLMRCKAFFISHNNDLAC